MARKISVVFGIVSACFCSGIFVLAKRDVLATIGSSPGATASLESIAPSKTYGLYLTFKVEHDPEIQRAHWRLMPFRHVEVET